MNKTGKATQISDFSYALPVDECVYTISTAQANNLDTLLWQAERENWEYMPQYVGGQKIVPYGNNNRLPVQIRDLMDENNLAPGILARQKGLLYGEGPFLRSLRFENGEITKEFKDDREIMAWLKDWDYLKYIDAAMTDYLYLKGFFDIKLLERRGRISGQRPRIAALEFVSAKNGRKAHFRRELRERLHRHRHPNLPGIRQQQPGQIPRFGSLQLVLLVRTRFLFDSGILGHSALDYARFRSSSHIQIRYRQRVQRRVSCSFSRRILGEEAHVHPQEQSGME